ncbi:MAG: signal peptide peptidase SppA [Raineya sp.]|nr:signal peptide peptidase SppA [Raineya sp.]MDW8296961.1 signal peptide peptidase SppA [Raineya sp.]
MKQFFKFVFATIVGLIVFSAIGIFILVGIISAIGADEKASVEENSVLYLNLSAPIAERSKENPFDDLGIPLDNSTSKIGLLEIVQSIKNAKNDKKIKGIYINTQAVQARYASLKEIRDALVDFKKSNKFIYAYAENYTEGAYYLASVADKIYLNPAGALEFNGIYTEIPFIKGVLEKLEVKPEVFRVGEFKSAVEPFILDKMSEANRLQTKEYLEAIYDVFLEDISASRKIEKAQLRRIADSILVRKAEDAQNLGLVTNVAYEDEILELLRKELKVDKKDNIKFISPVKYFKSIESKYSKNKIAVLFAEGEINSGTSGEDNIGSETIVKELRKLRKDEKVKAIVLRINSPGGSALASDVMWREIMLTKKEKPVIASMSDVAASGGYYLAMACDTIVAQKNTITGSIGVFGLLFNAENLLKNKIGVTTDRVSTSPLADIGNPVRKLSEQERAILQASVERVYETFTTKAAQGRRMSIDDLKKVASGRVWTGSQAKEKGLIDVFGSLDDAIMIAAKKAKVEKDYQVKYYPIQQDFWQKITKKKQEETFLKEKLGSELYENWKLLEKIRNWQGVQARLPFEIVVR